MLNGKTGEEIEEWLKKLYESKYSASQVPQKEKKVKVMKKKKKDVPLLNIPEQFYCPLTLQVMMEPMIADDGK
jgi:hypothetical protein